MGACDAPDRVQVPPTHYYVIGFSHPEWKDKKPPKAPTAKPRIQKASSQPVCPGPSPSDGLSVSTARHLTAPHPAPAIPTRAVGFEQTRGARHPLSPRAGLLQGPGQFAHPRLLAACKAAPGPSALGSKPQGRPSPFWSLREVSFVLETFQTQQTSMLSGEMRVSLLLL